MTAQKGSLVLLKIGDGGSPESFTTIGGLRVSGFSYINKPVDVTTKDSGDWQTVLDGAGISSASIAGAGVFTDSDTEEVVRSCAMSKAVRNYELCFGNGDKLSGPFMITSYKREGMISKPEAFSLSLASAGEIDFIAA